jgi:hypothetical protein
MGFPNGCVREQSVDNKVLIVEVTAETINDPRLAVEVSWWMMVGAADGHVGAQNPFAYRINLKQ